MQILQLFYFSKKMLALLAYVHFLLYICSEIIPLDTYFLMAIIKYILLAVVSTAICIAIIVSAHMILKQRLYKKYGLKPGSRVESRRQRRLRETQDKMFEEM